MTEAGGTDDTAPNAAQDRIQEINQRAHAAVDRAADAADKAAACVAGFPRQLNDKTCEYVRAQPLKAVGIAFASGLLLGRLLR